MNDSVYEWFSIARAKSFPISGPILQAEALKFAAALKLENFKASNGWLRSFKIKHDITFQTSCGESKSVDENSTSLWKTMLVDLCDGYEPKNIANMDETALFFKALPNKTLQLKREKCSGGKHSKERITLLLIVFGDGTSLKPDW